MSSGRSDCVPVFAPHPEQKSGGIMMPRKTNRPVLIAALGVAAVSLAACNDAVWIATEITQGGPSPGSSGGASPDTGGTSGTGGQSACQSDVLQAKGAGCIDVGILKQEAIAACDMAGLTLSDYAPYDACGTNSYRSVKYECCPKIDPVPPPESACTNKTQGSP